MDLAVLFTVLHLIGVAFGAGGAYVSDALFFNAIRNNHISKTELRFLGLGSKLVWTGLGILILSGLGLFLLDPVYYMASSKFLAKMTIVAVITGNGLIFEYIHFGHLRFHVGKRLYSIERFMAKSPALVASGVVSVISWTLALVLGSMSSVPYSYSTIIGVYVGVVLVAVLGVIGYLKRHHLLGKTGKY